MDFYKRPFVPPYVALYSYYAVLTFLATVNPRAALEIGCGLAAFSFRYASRLKDAQICATDVSGRLIDFLSKEYGRYYRNLTFKQIDFCQKKLRTDEHFDLIYSSDVLEHVHEPTIFVENLYKSLTAGGMTITNFPNLEEHGINHFEDVGELFRLFAFFADVQIYSVHIPKGYADLYFHIHNLYDKFTSGKYTKKSRSLHLSDKQGIDCFEDSSAFEFAISHSGFMNIIACAFLELLLLHIPKIGIRPVQEGSIKNEPRLVVIASA